MAILRLETELAILRDELRREAELAKESVNLVKEKLILAKQAEKLREELLAEKREPPIFKVNWINSTRRLRCLLEPKNSTRS